jgi:hypothetical protein
VNPTSGTISVSATDQGSAQGRVGDRTPISNGIIMTAYDPKSIMSYCSSVNGRASSDSNPTPYDMLGMEMLYSTTRTYGLGCGIGCFVTSSGVVTSTAGSIVSEWIMRGSAGVPFRVSGTSTDVYSYAVAGLPSGPSTLNYSFHDPVGHARSGSGVVNKSNTSYAALAGAIAMVY